jgi:hypothetical protein
MWPRGAAVTSAAVHPQQPAPVATASALAAAPQHAPDASASATVPQQVLATGTWAVAAGVPQQAPAAVEGVDASGAVPPMACVVCVVIVRSSASMLLESTVGA